VNHDDSLVVTIIVPCYLWAPSTGDHFFACGARLGRHRSNAFLAII